MGTRTDIQALPSTGTPREAVDAFLGYLKRRGRAPKTLRRYGPDLEAFVAWAGDTSLSDIDAAAIDFRFLPWWTESFEKRNGRAPSVATLRAVHISLSSFYRFLHNYGLIARNPMLAIEAPRVRQRAIDWLRSQEDERLLDLSMEAHEEILVWFLRWTGLRLSEALSLRIQDVDLVDRTVLVSDSKSESGIREVPIAAELVPRIRAWLGHLESKGLTNSRGYFLSTTRPGHWKRDGIAYSSEPGQPMKPQQVERIVKRVGARADIDGLTPHKLRKTFGSYLLNRGVRLETVSDLLGHADSRVTQQAYAALTTETVRREMFEALGA